MAKLPPPHQQFSSVTRMELRIEILEPFPSNRSYGIQLYFKSLFPVYHPISGEKRITFEEFLPIYEQLTKEKEQGSFADFMEGLRVFDKDETGKIMAAELRHILVALGKDWKVLLPCMLLA